MVGLVGWFLMASARSVERWLILDDLVAGIRVSEAMEKELETISPQLTLDTFAPAILDGTVGPALPVLHDDVLVGIIGAAQVRAVPQRNWPIHPDRGRDGRRPDDADGGARRTA